MTSYCSIDLDYWLGSDYLYTNNNPPSIPAFHSFMELFTHVQDRVLVNSHDGILNHLHETNPSLIIHVDYHQDIAYPGKYIKYMELNEGTFFYYLKQRKQKDYVWYYPDKLSLQYGLCVQMEDKPFSKKNWIFHSQTRKLGLPTKSTINKINHLGFAISYNYLSESIDAEYVKELISPYFSSEQIELAFTLIKTAKN